MDMMLGCALVQTTHNRGFTPEEIAEQALMKLVYVGENAPPAIRDQALAYKDRVRAVLLYYLTEAVKSDRLTMAIKLEQAGHPELAKLYE